MSTYNYLWGKTDYSELPPEDRLTQEIHDFVQWIEPTQDEAQIRLFTIMKYTNFIEYIVNSGNIEAFTKKGFKNKCQVSVAGQGSSFTNCYIPTGDIDLIVLGFPDNINVSNVLFKIVGQLNGARLISNAIVLHHAKVPIAKIIDRQFGIHIDISIGQINGSLNIPRVINYFESYPLLRSILLVMKAFTLINEVSDPAKGGFGSNHIMLIIIFVIQQNPDIQTEGELLMAVLKFISCKMNIFLTGISINDGGRFFSKFSIEFDRRLPHTIICQDPQYPDNYYGIRSRQTLLLAEKCKNALETIQSDLSNIKQTTINPTPSNFFSKQKIEYVDSDYSDDDSREDASSENHSEGDENKNRDEDYSSDDVVEICGPSILGKILIGINIIIERRKELKELAALWKLPPREYVAKLATREQNLRRSKSTPNLQKENKLLRRRHDENRKNIINDISKFRSNGNKSNKSNNSSQTQRNNSHNNKNSQNSRNNQNNRNQLQNNPNQRHKHNTEDFLDRRNYSQDRSNRYRSDDYNDHNNSNNNRNNRNHNKFYSDRKKPYKR